MERKLWNGAVFTSGFLLALWCHGNAAVWGCHHSLYSSEGISQAGPTTSILKNLPQKVGCVPYPAGSAVPAPQCQASPICGGNGCLRPFTVSKIRLTFCLHQGWHFLGRKGASCPVSLPQSCLQLQASRAALGSARREASSTRCFAVRWSWLGAAGALPIAGLGAMGP